jgi:DNA transformation protein and related proteins
LVAPAPVPFVAKKEVSTWTWECATCGGRPGLLESPGYLKLPDFISAATVPLGATAFAVGWPDEPLLCISAARWSELAGRPTSKGIASWPVIALDPASVADSVFAYPIPLYQQLSTIQGTFRMGSPTNEVDRHQYEGPQTVVTISRGLWMGQYEVTQGEYLAVMGTNPSRYKIPTLRLPPSAAKPAFNMPVSGGYRSFVLDQLERVCPVTAKSMFGGVGLYAQDAFFALIAEDRLYFKVDDTTRPDFERLGMEPFRPFREDKAMGYYEVSADVLEDRAQMETWMRKSIGVAARAKRKKGKSPDEQAGP